MQWQGFGPPRSSVPALLDDLALTPQIFVVCHAGYCQNRAGKCVCAGNLKYNGESFIRKFGFSILHFASEICDTFVKTRSGMS